MLKILAVTVGFLAMAYVGVVMSAPEPCAIEAEGSWTDENCPTKRTCCTKNGHCWCC